MRWLAALAAFNLAACATQHTLVALERSLAAQDSATAALTGWCHARGIADPPIITARRLKAEMTAPGPAIRSLLAVAPDEPIGFRHVQLLCGAAVLSVARNWYVPSRLTPEMNRALDTSDAPFGRVAAPLHFSRQRLESNRGQTEGCPEGTVLTNHAMLRLPDGRPLALVVECYTAANLAAPRRSGG